MARARYMRRGRGSGGRRAPANPEPRTTSTDTISRNCKQVRRDRQPDGRPSTSNPRGNETISPRETSQTGTTGGGGGIHLSATHLRQLRTMANQVGTEERRLTDIVRNRTERDLTGKICIDSGATRTIIKKKGWLKALLNRIELQVSTALGHKARTNRHGPLGIYVQGGRDRSHFLDKIGDAHLMDDLVHSLMSVSQLTDHGLF